MFVDGTKRTFAFVAIKSAFDPKRTRQGVDGRAGVVSQFDCGEALSATSSAVCVVFSSLLFSKKESIPC